MARKFEVHYATLGKNTADAWEEVRGTIFRREFVEGDYALQTGDLFVIRTYSPDNHQGTVFACHMDRFISCMEVTE